MLPEFKDDENANNTYYINKTNKSEDNKLVFINYTRSCLFRRSEN